MYSNQTLNWLPMDTEQRYLENLKNHYLELEKFGWIDCPITYKFNNFGFRSDEFSHDPNIVFLGCSHTCGIGIPLEQTWAHIVSSNLGFKNFNLGIGGTSNDTAFRIAQHWVPQLIPSIVIFLSTERTRFELHLKNLTILDCGIWLEKEQNNKFIWNEWIGNDININMNYLKNKFAIEQICNNLGIKFIHFEYTELFKDVNYLQNDFARDLSHGGVLTNQFIADKFLSQL
jgi:hypothetical protein